MARNKKHRPVAEINVVPYIDVMLVLLIIFMVTAPMLMQGVKVELPEANTDPVENQDSEPLIVSIKSDGQLFLNLGGDKEQALSLATIREGSRWLSAETPRSRCWYGAIKRWLMAR